MEAYDSGLKGITVYRDGCRTGVLNSIKKEVIDHVVRRERPKTTDIKIHKVKYKNLNYMVLVGLVDGKPIEVFGGLEEGLSLPTKYQSATLTKKSRGHYSLVVQLSDDPEDILKVNNVSARFPAEDIMTITRLISLSMRNGVPVSEITDQLQKSAGGMFEAPAIFARVLKNYLEDEDLVQMAALKVCPQCGGEIEIRRESGCLIETCQNTKCGWINSKCS
jgi:ribonucleoside-diphosphate reductase alpha chain